MDSVSEQEEFEKDIAYFIDMDNVREQEEFDEYCRNEMAETMLQGKNSCKFLSDGRTMSNELYLELIRKDYKIINSPSIIEIDWTPEKKSTKSCGCL